MFKYSCYAILFVLLLLFLSCCASKPEVPDIHNSVVAVWDLDDLTPGINTLPNMGEFLSDGIIEVLQEKEGIKVVERERIIQILQELKLGSNEIADPATRLRLGRLAGARLMIFGGYQAIGNSVRFDLRLVDVETGKILKTSEKTITSKFLNDWLHAVQEAGLELFKNRSPA